MRHDEVGVEAVVRVHDQRTGVRGVLVIDNSVFGPAGGGTRMCSDLTEDEVGDLARAMTYKWGVFDLPSGGAKAGIFADPRMPAAQKRDVLLAFGRALRPYLTNRDFLLGVGPDMGVEGTDVDMIYEGAGASNVCTWESSNEWFIDGDQAAYHLTGRGVAAAAKAALEHLGKSTVGATYALEGFGQVGSGTARYMQAEGARLVAVSTLEGAIFDSDGIDVEHLLELRRELGDACVLKYQGGLHFERLALEHLFQVPCDVLIPGARPRVINGFTQRSVNAHVICPAGNLSVTMEAERKLHQRGVICMPDFVCNSGGIIATWVDIVGGDAERALSTVGRMVRETSASLLDEARASNQSIGATARTRVRDRLLTSRRGPVSYASALEQARRVLGMDTTHPAAGAVTASVAAASFRNVRVAAGTIPPSGPAVAPEHAGKHSGRV